MIIRETDIEGLQCQLAVISTETSVSQLAGMELKGD